MMVKPALMIYYGSEKDVAIAFVAEVERRAEGANRLALTSMCLRGRLSFLLSNPSSGIVLLTISAFNLLPNRNGHGDQ